MMDKPARPTPRPIAAVITDGPEATAVARRAAALACAQRRPTVLLVPLAQPAFTTDAAIAARLHREALREAETVAARAHPALDATGALFHLQLVRYRACPFRRAPQSQAIALALARAARRAGAAVIITPSSLPVPSLKHGAEVLFVVADAAPRSHESAPSGPLGDRLSDPARGGEPPRNPPRLLPSHNHGQSPGGPRFSSVSWRS